MSHFRASLTAGIAVLFLMQCVFVTSLHVKSLHNRLSPARSRVQREHSVFVEAQHKLKKGDCLAIQADTHHQNSVFAANVDGETCVYKLESTLASVREYFYHHFAVLNGFDSLHFELLVAGEKQFAALVKVVDNCVLKKTLPNTISTAFTTAKVVLRMDMLQITTLASVNAMNYLDTIGRYAAIETVTTASDKFPYPKASSSLSSIGDDSGAKSGGYQNSFVGNGKVLALDIDTADPVSQVANPENHCKELFKAYKMRIAQTVCTPKKSPFGKLLEDYLVHNGNLQETDRSTAVIKSLVKGAKDQFETISNLSPASIDAIVTDYKLRHPTFDSVVSLSFQNLMEGNNPPGPRFLNCWVDLLNQNIIFNEDDKKTFCIGDNCCLK